MTKFSQNQLNLIEKTVSNWSDDKTIKRASEELLELSLSLLHFDRNKASISDIKKEMADVKIALQHLEFRFGNYQSDLDKRVIKE